MKLQIMDDLRTGFWLFSNCGYHDNLFLKNLLENLKEGKVQILIISPNVIIFENGSEFMFFNKIAPNGMAVLKEYIESDTNKIEIELAGPSGTTACVTFIEASIKV